MVLFIKPLTPDKEVYLKNIEEYLVINSVCKIDKSIEYELYLINDSINEFGLLNKTEILLDELLLTTKIDRIYLKGMELKEIQKYTDYYGVNVYSI